MQFRNAVRLYQKAASNGSNIDVIRIIISTLYICQRWPDDANFVGAMFRGMSVDLYMNINMFNILVLYTRHEHEGALYVVVRSDVYSANIKPIVPLTRFA